LEGRIGCETIPAGKAGSEVNEEVLARAARVRVLLMDVDGVMTNGTYWQVPDGRGGMVETKAFDSQDGIALKWLREAGIAGGVITGRDSPAVAERARSAGFAHVYQGHVEKIPILEEILEKAGVSADQVGYVGDDYTDVVIMHRVGLAVATANARPEVKAEAHFVTTLPGGRGAIREVVEILLRAQGRWDAILAHYEIGQGRRQVD
jgi:3-deoxy-D-manno-octulosonate 8-phosphate phosphatase (KDO 8-P phosphatase)